MITLEHVSKKYGDRYALRDFSLSIPHRQTLGLLGSNGAGKSTLLNILSGCLSPTSGKVMIDSINILTEPRQFKRKIGYLPENVPVYDEMTVRDYLVFVCRLRETAERSIREHVDEIAEMTLLTDSLSRRIGNLSKGLRQRVGLAQVLCGDPEILILDEPTSGLDPLQSNEFKKIILSLKGSKTILFSSHLLHEVQDVCTRAVILSNGSMVADKSLEARKGCTLKATIALGKALLLPALQSVDYIDKVEVLPEPQPGITSVILTCKPDTQPERSLFTLLAGMNAPILRLLPADDSLEDIFFRVCGNEPRKKT